jgi:esterase/lipase superfamily enzyme
MSGSRAAFSDINDRTVGTMRFIDDSVVFIKGVGTVVYECKNGEHHTLTIVYYIPRLWTSIISISQLDECEYEVGIRGGVLSLRDENQRLLARI